MSRFSALAMVLVLVSSMGARAAPPDDPATAHARELFEHAQALYALTHYAEALGEYEKAFETKPLPGFLFNIGQCHRQLGHFDRAAYFFHAYIDRRPGATNRALVDSLIAEMESRMREAPALDMAAAPTTERPHDAGVDAAPIDLAEAPVHLHIIDAAAPIATAPAPLPLFRRWYSWAAIAVVVVVVAFGLGFGLSGAPVPHGTLSNIDATSP